LTYNYSLGRKKNKKMKNKSKKRKKNKNTWLVYTEMETKTALKREFGEFGGKNKLRSESAHHKVLAEKNDPIAGNPYEYNGLIICN
jgi:hypothetical protein